MKKTTLAKLIEFMGQNQYFIGNDLYAKQKELLEEERENLIEAYDDGRKSMLKSSGLITLQQYFNNTYEQ